MWGYGKHSPVSISNGSMFHLYHSEFDWRYVNCCVDIVTESICMCVCMEGGVLRGSCGYLYSPFPYSQCLVMIMHLCICVCVYKITSGHSVINLR